MRYIKDIIPSNAKVLPDYFNGSSSNIAGASSAAKAIGAIIAVALFLFSLYSITHPLLALLSIIMGLGLLPSMYPWIEQKLQFDYTPAVRLLVYGILLLPFLGMAGYYGKADARLAQEQLLIKQQQQREQEIAAVKDSIRRDSLHTYLSLLKHKHLKGNLSDSETNSMLKKSFSMAVSQEEKHEITVIKYDIDKENTLKLVKAGKYRPAVISLTDLLAQSPEDPSLLYNRALCYDKLGEQEGAVRDLRLAMRAGSTEAEKYHDKINPERKRVTGYITRCCDGSTSYARGRGACSWHGGVCNWNDPIYETYRKYE